MNKKYAAVIFAAVLASASSTASAAQDNTDRKVLYWYDPMMPATKFDKPGKSPFMDMQLVPKYAEPESEAQTGKPVISISAGNIQKLGVRVEKAAKSTLRGGIRATGSVLENERGRRDMFSQVEGRVDRLIYSAPGDQVKQGELFYTLYSPELLALQNDYLAALNSGYTDLAAAARQRMRLLGVSDAVLVTLARTGKALESVPFYIPASGILTRLEIHQGYYLQLNAGIGRIQDLSSVWVEAAIAEKDLSAIKQGGRATVTVAGSGAALEAVVDYVYPAVTPETRTGRARLVVANSGYLLKPGTYATLIFAASDPERLTVPSSAVLRDSSGGHVIVALGDGKFQARPVQTGVVSAGKTEITSGLSEGEDVVTGAQFLIDSESSLNESLDKMSPHGAELPMPHNPQSSPEKPDDPGMPGMDMKGMEMDNGK